MKNTSKAIQAAAITCWVFEVIEIIEIPDNMKILSEVNAFIFEREMYYIKQFDSIEKGYNSLASKADDTDIIKNQIQLFAINEGR